MTFWGFFDIKIRLPQLCREFTPEYLRHVCRIGRKWREISYSEYIFAYICIYLFMSILIKIQIHLFDPEIFVHIGVHKRLQIREVPWEFQETASLKHLLQSLRLFFLPEADGYIVNRHIIFVIITCFFCSHIFLYYNISPVFHGECLYGF